MTGPRTHQHLITRLVRARCPKCQRPIWNGSVKGVPARLDADVNLPPDLERVAFDRGVRTFDATRNFLSVTYRDPRRIAWNDSGCLRVPEHRCDVRWPTTPTLRPARVVVDEPDF